VAGVVIYGWNNSQSVAQEEAVEEIVIPKQRVTAIAVQSQPIQRRLEATGTVMAYDLLPILPKASGLQIEEVLVDEGDWVTTGQVLAVLDRAVLTAQLQQIQAQLTAAQAVVQQRQAALAQAQATLAEAETNLTRFQNLAAEGAISQQDLDTRSTTVATASESVRVAVANIASAEAEVQNQEARIQQMETQIAQTLVKAPANGLVAERFARVGDLTSNSDALFSVIRDRRLELQVTLPETQLPQVRVGAGVEIASDSDPTLKLRGTVREIAPLIDPETRQARLDIDLPSSDRLRPGMFLRATLILSQASSITVPAQAVLPQADGTSVVYRLGNGDGVSAQMVEVGQVLDSTAPGQSQLEIVTGLQLGDRIVVAGAGYLKDGDQVEVIEELGTNLPMAN
jgi:RND family efflux transporter MFP subunit